VARAKETDVFILANHGLVVCGQNCAATEELLCEVEHRLAISARPFPMPDSVVLGNIARFCGWQNPDCDSLHALGTDKAALKILKGGVLYPCQAIFLGLQALTLPHTLAASKLKARLTGGERPPSFVVVRKKRGNAEREHDQRRAGHFDWPDGSRAPNGGIRTTPLFDQRRSGEGGQRGRARIQRRSGDRGEGKFRDGDRDIRPGTRSPIQPQHVLFIVAVAEVNIGVIRPS